MPVVTVASAAPAFAGTGCCHLSGSGTANWEPKELNYIDINLDLANGCSTAVAGLTVILTICGLDDITYTGADEYLPDGWVQGGQGNKDLTKDQNGCYTLTYTSAQTLAGGGSTNVKFVAKTKAYVGSGNRPGGSITVNVMSGSCNSDASVITLPAFNS